MLLMIEYQFDTINTLQQQKKMHTNCYIRNLVSKFQFKKQTSSMCLINHIKKTGQIKIKNH